MFAGPQNKNPAQIEGNLFIISKENVHQCRLENIIVWQSEERSFCSAGEDFSFAWPDKNTEIGIL